VLGYYVSKKKNDPEMEKFKLDNLRKNMEFLKKTVSEERMK
jgi:hypothetical protein